MASLKKPKVPAWSLLGPVPGACMGGALQQGPAPAWHPPLYVPLILCPGAVQNRALQVPCEDGPELRWCVWKCFMLLRSLRTAGLAHRRMHADKTWAVLEAAIHEIFNQNQSGLSFEELYRYSLKHPHLSQLARTHSWSDLALAWHPCRNAYNMVINKCGDRLYSGLVAKTSSHLATVAARIEAAQGDTFLSELRSCWNVHIKSMQMIRDILMVRSRPLAAT